MMAWQQYPGCVTVFDIIEAMDDLLVGVGWTQCQRDTIIYEGSTRTRHVIWEGVGDGTDRIYIQARVPDDNNTDLYLDSMVGFDSDLEWWEQPGSIQQWLKSAEGSEVPMPMFTVTGESRFKLWLFADTYHVVGVAVFADVVFESFYVGFINPIASERQYPYPMYVGGNSHVGDNPWPANTTGSFIFPADNSGWIRRADGVWRALQTTVPDPDPDSVGTVFPYNSHNTSLISNYAGINAMTRDNFLLIPVMLQTNGPVDVCGVLRDVFWITGRQDIGAGEIVEYNDEQYLICDVKEYKMSNTYFCVKMAGSEQ